MNLATRRRTPAAWADRGLVMLAFLLCAASGSAAFRSRSAAAEASAAARAARQDVALAEQRLRSLSARAPAATEDLAARALLNASAPLPRILAELGERMPPGVRLQSLSVTYGERVHLQASVEARTVAAWDAFLEQLAASRRFDELRPGPEQREGEVRTSLQLVYEGEGS